MKPSNHDLIKELRAEGASAVDARALAGISRDLQLLKDPAPMLKQRSRGALHWVSFAGVALGGAVVAAGLIVLAAVSLSSLPGQLLHGVKDMSEAAAVSVDPALRPDIMMDKSWEVAQLASDHQPPARISAALSSYNQAFNNVQGQDYAAWTYCSKELLEASRDTTGPTKAAINRSLAAVDQDGT